MMNDEEVLAELLSTPEGQAKVADAMVQPFRCGGLYYDEGGNPVYRHEWEQKPDGKDEE